MNDSSRPESPLGRYLHRTFFKVMSFLPRRIRITLQRLIFDVLFKSSSDPWSYQDSEYEAKKREALVASLPPEFTSLLEIGCADGHNLSGIRGEFPNALLVGLDISRAAIKRAKDRNPCGIEFVEAEPGVSARLLAEYGTFDLVLFSEVLYYIGNQSAWKQSLTPLKSLLHPGSIVIAVHPMPDAAQLHQRLCDILKLEVLNSQRYVDESRPYEIMIATLPEG